MKFVCDVDPTKRSGSPMIEISGVLRNLFDRLQKNEPIGEDAVLPHNWLVTAPGLVTFTTSNKEGSGQLAMWVDGQETSMTILLEDNKLTFIIQPA